jgi:hypothetical protein
MQTVQDSCFFLFIPFSGFLLKNIVDALKLWLEITCFMPLTMTLASINKKEADEYCSKMKSRVPAA